MPSAPSVFSDCKCAFSVVVDYDNQNNQTKVVWAERRPDQVYAEAPVAVNGDGSIFAITKNNAQVRVFAREGSGDFDLVSTIKAPQYYLTPVTLAFSKNPKSGKSLLVVVWCDQVSEYVVVTAHAVDKTATALLGNGTAVQQLWQYQRQCPGSSDFDFVVPAALSVSRDGEVIGVGSWGCLGGDRKIASNHSSDGHRHPAIVGGTRISSTPNMVVLEGWGGTGKPLVSSSVPGQLWAVDAETVAGETYVAFASWSTQDGSIPSQVTTLAFK